MWMCISFFRNQIHERKGVISTNFFICVPLILSSLKLYSLYIFIYMVAIIIDGLNFEPDLCLPLNFHWKDTTLLEQHTAIWLACNFYSMDLMDVTLYMNLPCFYVNNVFFLFLPWHNSNWHLTILLIMKQIWCH